MPQHHQPATPAPSNPSPAPHPDASRNFMRQNSHITLLTTKQITRLQRTASQTQESPDASRAPPTSNQQPATSNQKPETRNEKRETRTWTTPTPVPQNRSSARL